MKLSLKALAFSIALGLTLSPLGASAQYDDQYDPFADFSEFDDEDEKQRRDIEFFESGRLLTVGFLGGYRGWTSTYANINQSAPAFGFFLSYFFDLRFALQVSFLSGNHAFTIPRSPTNPALPGNNSFSSLSVDLKYYINPQNIAQGIALLNPYLLGGFSQNYRTVTVVATDAFNKESGFGANLGLGMETNVLNDNIFLGAQGVYRLVNFPDDGQEFINDGERTGVIRDGDVFEIMAVLGINF